MWGRLFNVRCDEDEMCVVCVVWDMCVVRRVVVCGGENESVVYGVELCLCVVEPRGVCVGVWGHAGYVWVCGVEVCVVWRHVAGGRVWCGGM